MIKWNKKEYELTLELFSKLKKENRAMHASNPDVVALARKTGRSANSIAMRLQNFEYYASGKRGGLPHGSKMCEEVYNECWQQLGLPSPVATVSNASMEEMMTLAAINDVVVNIAMAVNDMSLIKGDSVDLFDSLTTILKYINSESFTLRDMKVLSAAIKSIPDYPNDLLRSSLRSSLPESQFSKINTLIELFY
ncbi:hypothetical protein [uncultured Duncaniella sp.]|uniref:hypothetical protein n=1 Tax=uncultured Duncaniella sp. TaxID=2768039 RepID=UPI00272D2986|nr:hypothetical protein [uncultured Duncaniella sp.]